MLIHIDLNKVLRQLLIVKPDDLTVAAISVLIATQVIDFRLRATFINPVIPIIICVRRNAIASCSAGKHERRVACANVRDLGNNLLADKTVIRIKLHARKIGYASQTNRRAPTFSGNTCAVFDCTFVLNGHPIDVSNTFVVNATRNATEPLA